MLRRFLILMAVPVAMASAQLAPNQPFIAGRAMASAFGGWTVGAQVLATGGSSGSVSPDVPFFTEPGGFAFTPFLAGVPVEIADGANGETVTITSTNCAVGSNPCTFSANFAHSHAGRLTISSGTFGLQEAIDAMKSPGGSVVVSPDWRGTTAMITGASGKSNVEIVDERTGATAWYGWTGSAYLNAFCINNPPPGVNCASFAPGVGLNSPTITTPAVSGGSFAGGTFTGGAFNGGAIAPLSVGAVYYAEQMGGLTAAVATLGHTTAALGCSTAQTLSGDLSIPANVNFEPQPGCVITRGGYSLKIAAWSPGAWQVLNPADTGSLSLPANAPILPEWWGATNYGQVYSAGGAIASGSHNLTAPCGCFSAASVGDTIMIGGAGAGGVALVTTISAYTDSSHVTLTAAAGNTAANSAYIFGADDFAALNAWLWYISTNGALGELSNSIYIATQPLVTASQSPTVNWGIVGAGKGSALWNLGTGVSAWSSSATYLPGQMVSYGGGEYVAIAPGTNQTPSFSQVSLAGSSWAFMPAASFPALYIWGNSFQDVQLFNGRFENFSVEGNPNVTDGFDCTVCAHSLFTNFRAYNVADDAFHFGNGNVDTLTNVAADKYEDPSLGSEVFVLPAEGIVLDGWAPFIPAWSSGAAYNTGALVGYQGAVYAASQSSTNQTPSGSSAYWAAQVTYFNESNLISTTVENVTTTGLDLASAATVNLLGFQCTAVESNGGVCLAAGAGSSFITGQNFDLEPTAGWTASGTQYGIVDQGSYNHWLDMGSAWNSVANGANSAEFSGGIYATLTIDANARNTKIGQFAWAGAGGLTDLSASTVYTGPITQAYFGSQNQSGFKNAAVAFTNLASQGISGVTPDTLDTLYGDVVFTSSGTVLDQRPMAAACAASPADLQLTFRGGWTWSSGSSAGDENIGNLTYRTPMQASDQGSARIVLNDGHSVTLSCNGSNQIVGTTDTGQVYFHGTVQVQGGFNEFNDEGTQVSWGGDADAGYGHGGVFWLSKTTGGGNVYGAWAGTNGAGYCLNPVANVGLNAVGGCAYAFLTPGTTQPITFGQNVTGATYNCISLTGNTGCGGAGTVGFQGGGGGDQTLYLFGGNQASTSGAVFYEWESGTATKVFQASDAALFSTGVAAASGSPDYVCYNTSTHLFEYDASACPGSLMQFKDIDGRLGQSDALRKLLQLNTYWCHYKAGVGTDDARVHGCFLAQDVAKVEPRAADYDAAGGLRSVRPETIQVLTVAAIQEQQKEIDELRQAVKALQAELESAHRPE